MDAFNLYVSMSYFDTLSKDLLTLLVSYIPNQYKLGLMAAFPELSKNIDWMTLYQQRYSPLYLEMRDIHERHFSITKGDRIDDMIEYYHKLDTRLLELSDDDPDKFDEETWEFQNIRISDFDGYKYEDYVYSITDYIYDEITEYKKEKLGFS
jgi:hypothetical protein